MNKDDLFKVFLINDLMDLPNAVTKILDMDLEDRNKIYRELIRLNDNDLSYDWFQEVYESDLSERKQKKTGLHTKFSGSIMFITNISNRKYT